MTSSKLLVLQLVFLTVITLSTGRHLRPENIDIFRGETVDSERQNRIPKILNSNPEIINRDENELNDHDHENENDADIEGGHDDKEIEKHLHPNHEHEEGTDSESEVHPSHEDNPDSVNGEKDDGAESHSEPGKEDVPEEVPEKEDVPEEVPEKEDVPEDDPEEDIPPEENVPEDVPEKENSPDEEIGKDDLPPRNFNLPLGSILGNPILGLKLVNEYFFKLEKAMEQAFRESLADALSDESAFTNKTDEVVEINGQKYNVHKTFIKSGDKNSAVVIQSIASEPVSNLTKT